jgi:hypothetical protein
MMPNSETLGNAKTDALEKRIAAVLANGNAGSVDLMELIAAVEAAASDADQAAKVERDKAVDLVVSPDAQAAHNAVIVAELRRDRLQAVLPRLRERLSQAKANEYTDRWLADFNKVARERDALAKEFQEVYPAAINKLLDLLQRIARNDAECTRVNADAPGSESRRLRSAELVARGLQHFTRDTPSLTERTALPDPDNSAALLWPPPQLPLGVAVAMSMGNAASGGFGDPRRYSDRWWEVAQEDEQRRQIESERLTKYYEQTTREQETRINAEEAARRR